VARTFIGEKEMATIIDYESTKLRSMMNPNSIYSASEYVQNAEKQISLLAEEIIKSLLDDGYNPLKIIEIFSEHFDNSQIRKIVALYIGMEELKSLEESENET
jgi:hypothetical protein